VAPAGGRGTEADIPPKPHRALAGRVAAYAEEARAYLHRRRAARSPFARVYLPGGHGASHPPDTEVGRELFLAAARLIDTARDRR
jgi:hypothetical protein